MKSSAFVVTALLSMVWLVGCGSETESGGGLPPADAPNGGTGEAMLVAAGEAPGSAAAAASYGGGGGGSARNASTRGCRASS